MENSQNKSAIEGALLEAAGKQNYFSARTVDQYPQDYVIVENKHYNYCERCIDRNLFESLKASGFIKDETNKHGTKGFRVNEIS